MSNEEREFVVSFGGCLVVEWVYLLQLFVKLGIVFLGLVVCEFLDEQISVVEEKIVFMMEMLRLLRYGVVFKIDGLIVGEMGFWVFRVFGILGRDLVKMQFWKEWL